MSSKKVKYFIFFIYSLHKYIYKCPMPKVKLIIENDSLLRDNLKSILQMYSIKTICNESGVCPRLVRKLRQTNETVSPQTYNRICKAVKQLVEYQHSLLFLMD